MSVLFLIGRLKFNIFFGVFIYSFFVFTKTAFAVPIVNSDFSSGLASWTAAGDVTVSGGAAILGDDCGIANPCGRLFQLVQINSGDYTLEFDINFSQIAPNSTPGVFPDMAFGSLYFDIDGNFDIDNLNFTSVNNLFDADFNGAVFSSGVNTSPSVLGQNWLHVTFQFIVLAQTYVAPVFELFDLDFTEGSKLLVDNVEIKSRMTVVPEPSTVLLFSVAAGALFRRKKG